MLILKKYGSAAMTDKEDLFCIAEKCAEEYKNGNDVVVVLDAMEGETEMLIRMAKELNAEPSQREMDMLLSMGTQKTAAMLAIALEEMELPAVSLNGAQAGIYTNKRHGNAEIVSVEADRIVKELEQKKIVVVAGGQGITEEKEVTTLKYGADATAFTLADVLDADVIELDTDMSEENAA